MIAIARPDTMFGKSHTYEELAIVTVAWTEAKALAPMLSDIVSRYENLNGEIKDRNNLIRNGPSVTSIPAVPLSEFGHLAIEGIANTGHLNPVKQD